MTSRQHAVLYSLILALVVALAGTASAQIAAMGRSARGNGNGASSAEVTSRGPTASSAEISSRGAGAERLLTLSLQDVPVRTAVDMMFHEAGLNYAFEGGISGMVNVNITDVPFDQALQVVLRSAGLTMRRENNTYMIGPKKEIQPVTEISGGLVQSDETEIARSTTQQKIVINFLDVSEIGAIFGAQYQGQARYGGPGGYSGYGSGMGMGMGMGMMSGMGMSSGYGNGMMNGYGNSMMNGYGNSSMNGYGNNMMSGYGNSMSGMSGSYGRSRSW